MAEIIVRRKSSPKLSGLNRSWRAFEKDCAGSHGNLIEKRDCPGHVVRDTLPQLNPRKFPNQKVCGRSGAITGELGRLGRLLDDLNIETQVRQKNRSCPF